MRRFSQRNNLVTLSDINITPLLDLAFVLLIIFVITTPLLEQGMDMSLPSGGKPDEVLQKENIRQVDVMADGRVFYGGRLKTIDQIETELRLEYKRNKKLTVFIRADENGKVGKVVELIDRCRQIGVGLSIRTKDEGKKGGR